MDPNLYNSNPTNTNRINSEEKVTSTSAKPPINKLAIDFSDKKDETTKFIEKDAGNQQTKEDSTSKVTTAEGGDSKNIQQSGLKKSGKKEVVYNKSKKATDRNMKAQENSGNFFIDKNNRLSTIVECERS